MKWSSMKWVLAVLLILTLIFISACGGGDDDSATPTPPTGGSTPPPASGGSTEPPEPKEPVTIRFSNWAQSDTYDRVNAAFTEDFPHITVEWVFSGGHGSEHFANLLTENLAAGNPIDVYFNSSFMADVLDGYAADLTPFIENDPEFQAYPFLPGTMENFNVDGKQYALPRGTEVFLVFYNKEMLDKYGLSVPKYDWTWEDFREMAIAATNPAEGEFGLGNGIVSILFGAPAVIAAANGSAPRPRGVNEDYTAVLTDQADVLEDMQWVYDLVYRDGVMVNANRAAELGVEGDLWSQGKSLFEIHVSPLMENWSKITPLDFEWDVLPFPAGTERQVSFLWAQPLFMAAASQHKEEVWEFMKWYTTSDKAQEIFLEFGTLLPNTDLPNRMDYFNNLPFYEKFDTAAIMHALANAEIDPEIVMIGGSHVTGLLHGYWAGPFWNEGVSPFDHFPAATETANSNIQADRTAMGL